MNQFKQWDYMLVGIKYGKMIGWNVITVVVFDPVQVKLSRFAFFL